MDIKVLYSENFEREKLLRLGTGLILDSYGLKMFYQKVNFRTFMRLLELIWQADAQV